MAYANIQTVVAKITTGTINNHILLQKLKDGLDMLVQHEEETGICTFFLERN